MEESLLHSQEGFPTGVNGLWNTIGDHQSKPKIVCHSIWHTNGPSSEVFPDLTADSVIMPPFTMPKKKERHVRWGRFQPCLILYFPRWYSIFESLEGLLDADNGRPVPSIISLRYNRGGPMNALILRQGASITAF
ncbi:hypothetical protein CDAR_211871 [Caerostris darwini]|uniref:Uncharacterized protein n=1 Tax=Caerostris darwini TaxID=1538125 RepID=A0AAV4PBP3_9ARAC|nr:hypothetical protein CDAR_211871 [Caerostris darwini]